MATIKRLINEEGIVLSKNYSEAKDSWTKSDGTEVAAQPEKYDVLVASGEKISTDTGIQNCVVLAYKVSREEFQNFKYLQRVSVSYEFSTFNTKPISVAPLKIGG